MAYFANDPNNRRKPVAGSFAGSPGSGTIGVPVGGAPPAPGQGGFVNLATYLGLNQGEGQKMAGQLTDDARSGLTNAAAALPSGTGGAEKTGFFGSSLGAAPIGIPKTSAPAPLGAATQRAPTSGINTAGATALGATAPASFTALAPTPTRFAPAGATSIAPTTATGAKFGEMAPVPQGRIDVGTAPISTQAPTIAKPTAPIAQAAGPSVADLQKNVDAYGAGMGALNSAADKAHQLGAGFDQRQSIVNDKFSKGTQNYSAGQGLYDNALASAYGGAAFTGASKLADYLSGRANAGANDAAASLDDAKRFAAAQAQSAKNESWAGSIGKADNSEETAVAAAWSAYNSAKAAGASKDELLRLYSEAQKAQKAYLAAHPTSVKV